MKLLAPGNHHRPSRSLRNADRSEIRFVRPRDRGIRSRMPQGVFGAHKFQPFVEGAPKRYGRRPRHRESATILNGDFDLQPLALVAWVDSRSIIGTRVLEIFF